MNPNSGRKKWVITIVIAAILIAAAVAVAILAGPGPDDPVIDVPKESPLGVYYYDTAEGEYLLTLSQGNVFMISGPSLNKSGKCVVTDTGIELDFVKDEDGTGSLKEENGVMVLQYKDKTMRFLEKKTYQVNFNVNGGSEVAAIDVINGKTVSKPADPKKDGSVFIGWYADEACTELYGFGNEVITADTTVYAKWAETVVGQNEYTVNFDLCYDGEAYEAMNTIGGKLYNVPNPTRDGFTFAGWWVSQTQNAEQLTIPYVEDMVFQANTTLFALWTTTPEGGKLAAPMVEVYENSIKWSTIQGASAYQLKITDAEGNVIHDEKLGATTENFDFGSRPAGEYTIEVTALSSVEDKNSETTTRTFVNKALDRVSLFTVIDGGILLWNGVEGAEKYLITIDCGNDAHKHTAFDNGDSTTFMFSNCAMQEGGIQFTVTAVADGKASSVSETFVYDRKLDTVGEILYNEETQSFYWDAVANAAKYSITVKVGNKSFTVDNGSATTFSAKYLSGDITLEIVPMTQGYNSPEATSTTYKKTSLATPEGLMVKGNILTWNAVEGATGYMVKINNQSFQAESNSLDLTSLTISLDSSTTYDISVMAVGTESSLYSDVVTMKYLAPIEQVTSKNNTVTWTPVMGVENYEVRVNGGEPITVSGTNSTKIELTKAGINTIEVRYTDLGGSIWTATEVFAYEVIYNSRSLSGTKSEFLAMGDTMTLPTDFTQDGYDFTGWYNAPEAAAGNGAACTETVFTGTGTTILYADWTPRTYYVTFEGLSGITNITKDDKQAVTYQDGYQLPIPEAGDEMGEFMGWYTGPGGSGIVLTDAKGNSLTDYAYTRDAVVYPAFNNGVLEYILQADGTYAVTAGPNIKGATTVTIPEYYKDIPVTTILENAFYSIATIEKFVIPATIKSIGVGAIPNLKVLKEINVYTDTIQQNYEVFYSSYDGALLRHDMDTVYLEIFPRGKTGEYTIPDHVDVIRDKAFRYSNITKLTVGNGVTLISRRAFYMCDALKILEFKDGGTDALIIDPEAFYVTTNLSVLRLPARLTETDLQILNAFTKLTTIEVEAGGANYSSLNNMICNASGDTILYTLMTISGEFAVPLGICEIGASAFENRPNLTKVIISSYVNKIGEAAFQNCVGISEVVVEGFRSNDLLIEKQAFAHCENIATIIFQGNGTTTADTGATIIGTSAFEGAKKLYNLVYEAGSNVTVIGARAFADCTLLKEAHIPATTVTVGDSAFSGGESIREVTFAPNGQQVTFGSNVFEGCKRLTTVNLPATISHFEGGVFAGCDAIREIIVDKGNPNFVTYDGALYSAGYEEIIFYPRALDGDLSKLHPDLKRIGNNVFQGNPKITKVNVSKNIVFIGNYAFENCYNLAKVTFEAGGSAMTIGASAFAKCVGLTGIQLPAYTSSIGASAFESTGLTAFVIPESTTTLGDKALKGTKIAEIIIPANVEAIGDGTFANTQLATVTFVEGTKPLTIGTLENNDKSNGVFVGTKIKEVTIGNRVTLIGGYAFYKLATLTTVTMSENCQVEEIGQYAFAETTKLTQVTLGRNLKAIYKYGFYKTKLADIFIPKSVTLVDQYAFSNAALTKVDFEFGGTAELAVNRYAFGTNSKLAEVNLPARLVTIYEFYKNGNITGQWKTVSNVFHNNRNIQNINVEPGGAHFASIDGILYEVNENGEADTLLYCPRGKTGDLVIAKEVRLVENGAFDDTKLSSIVFEEYPKDHEFYGQPLLEVGTGTAKVHSAANADYPVFSIQNTSVGKLTRISFPSHLKRLGANVCYGLNLPGTTITFNMDAHLTELGGATITNCVGITELQLPAVDALSPGTFYSNKSLVTLTLDPDSCFTVIPQSMAENCIALTTFFVPATVTKLDHNAFRLCRAMSAINFAEGTQLKEIGNYVFVGSGLQELVMPDTVEFIGSGPFSSCSQLRTITLSKRVQSVVTSSGSIFVGCSALENIFVSEGSPYFKSVDGVLYDVADTAIYCFPAAKDPTGFKLPETITTIATYAFHNFKGTSIELPENLETIADSAFANSMLISVHIPANVVSLGANAFSTGTGLAGGLESITFAPNSKLESIGNSCFNNSKLKNITIPDGVKSIGKKCFNGCQQLEEIILPAALERLEDSTCANLSQLKRIVIQEGLKTIVARAMERNPLLEELVIPSTVESIGNNACSYLAALQRLTFSEGSQLESLGRTAFGYCTSLQAVTLPAKLKRFNETSSGFSSSAGYVQVACSPVFIGCTGLKYVDMSACEDMTTMPGEMFSGCTAIETLLLPPNLEALPALAFGGRAGWNTMIYGLTSLKEITIPASVKSVGAHAFYGCENLEIVTFAEGSQLTELGVAEANSLNANNRGDGADIFYGTTSLKKVILPENLTTIGVGCFENSGIAEINLPSSITSIGARAFKNCVNIEAAALSANLQYLGDEAFFGCAKLETADLSFGLEYLGARAFAYCILLKKAYIPATITSMTGNPYTGCSGIESFELDPDNVDFTEVDGVLYDKNMYTLIYYPAFLTAESFEIPNTVHEIASGAFAGAKLKNIAIPDQITEILEYTFQNSAVESVKFHAGITRIGEYAFEGCANLNNVNMLSNIKTLGNYAFANCTSLSSFVFEDIPEGGEPYVIGTHFFEGCTSMTQLILPNRMRVSSEDIYCRVKDRAIPSYMFANTGIVNAVIPAWIVDLAGEGVFANCKQMETVTFLNKEYQGATLGAKCFYGCSKLKEITIPVGINNPLYYRSHIFAECTSLEKVTCYIDVADCYVYDYVFYNCKNLKEIQILKVGKLEKDENGTVTGYADVTEYGFSGLNDGALQGCASLKTLPIKAGVGFQLSGNPFKGCGIEVLVFEKAAFYNDVATFAGMPNLKQIWIGGLQARTKLYTNTFAGIDTDVNIYFYNQTYAQVKSAGGNELWFNNASQKVHFYFKDTMPADVQWPEEIKPAT